MTLAIAFYLNFVLFYFVVVSQKLQFIKMIKKIKTNKGRLSLNEDEIQFKKSLPLCLAWPVLLLRDLVDVVKAKQKK
jgi:hypothetical protein